MPQYSQNVSWVSPQALFITQALILGLHIQEGFGLATYLGINPTLSNHSALELWVQRQLLLQTNTELEPEDLNHFKQQLIGQIPSQLQGNCVGMME